MNKFYLKNSIHLLHQIKINQNKNFAQEIRQVEVPKLALPPTGTSPSWSNELRGKRGLGL